jgi:hypothetical protein
MAVGKTFDRTLRNASNLIDANSEYLTRMTVELYSNMHLFDRGCGVGWFVESDFSKIH